METLEKICARIEDVKKETRDIREGSSMQAPKALYDADELAADTAIVADTSHEAEEEETGAVKSKPELEELALEEVDVAPRIERVDLAAEHASAATSETFPLSNNPFRRFQSSYPRDPVRQATEKSLHFVPSYIPVTDACAPDGGSSSDVFDSPTSYLNLDDFPPPAFGPCGRTSSLPRSFSELFSSNLSQARTQQSYTHLDIFDLMKSTNPPPQPSYNVINSNCKNSTVNIVSNSNNNCSISIDYRI